MDIDFSSFAKTLAGSGRYSYVIRVATAADIAAVPANLRDGSRTELVLEVWWKTENQDHDVLWQTWVSPSAEAFRPALVQASKFVEEHRASGQLADGLREQCRDAVVKAREAAGA